MTDSKQSGSGAQSTGATQRYGEVLEERRMDMKSAEGHAGSVPRGNPEPEEENVGHHRDAYERVLGH
ncbi:MAG TPA: hypothetical protein VF052_00365 [Solirubrobacterales bacterium]|jgi:hypothetical protein